jgi:bifunctional ADP-heptose synthase (sugar kinase/adenylyltransferase)
MPRLPADRLRELLAAFPSLSIGLVGDLFLDRYLELVPGMFERSIETGLEAYQVAGVRNSPGALGTVMNNLAALGAGRLVPVTVIGDDGHGYDLLRELARLPIDTSHIVRDSQRLTPTYTKPMRPLAGQPSQELNRLDVRTRTPLSEATLQEVLARVRTVFDSTDGLIVLDQVSEPDCGVVHARVRDLLEELTRARPDKLVFIDSRAQLGKFRFGVLKGNRSELLGALGPGAAGAGEEQAALELARRTGGVVFATMGDSGIIAADAHGKVTLAPAIPVSGPIDIVGAGDSATSGIVTTLLAGGTRGEAAAVGNLVASITIQQLGVTGTATPEQVIARNEA